MARNELTLRQFQNFISDIYSLPDDRLYSIFDHVTQLQRFTMRALKGIRKEQGEKIQQNLLIAFSWLMAIANRLHIDVEGELWERFPGVCSYCAQVPCTCGRNRPLLRTRITGEKSERPASLGGFQSLFRKIYPPQKRTLSDAGVHLAEETGEVSEAIHNFLGRHEERQFDEIKLEIADYISCFFGVANSASIDVEAELQDMFKNGCHVCHKKPCVCNFSETIAFES